MTRIVELADKDPLVIEGKDGDVYVCRCGLSKDWPYCDSSHSRARKEEPGKTYMYHREEPGGGLKQEILSDPPQANPRPAPS